MSIIHLGKRNGAVIYVDSDNHSISCVGFFGFKDYGANYSILGAYRDANKSVNLWIKNVKRCL